jgi:hypothetical protein
MKEDLNTVVLLGPMRAEAAVMEPHVVDAAELEVMGMRFVVGQMGTTRVALASCGVGKVNAAMTTALSLQGKGGHPCRRCRCDAPHPHTWGHHSGGGDRPPRLRDDR